MWLLRGGDVDGIAIGGYSGWKDSVNVVSCVAGVAMAVTYSLLGIDCLVKWSLRFLVSLAAEAWCLH